MHRPTRPGAGPRLPVRKAEQMQRQYHGQSFPAIDSHGAEYQLTPTYRSAEGTDDRRQPTYAAADCVGLVTGDGRSVSRLNKGRYLITNADVSLQIALFSDDPHAP